MTGPSSSSAREASRGVPSAEPDSLAAAVDGSYDFPEDSEQRSLKGSSAKQRKPHASRGRSIGPQSPEHLRNRVNSLRRTLMAQSPEERKKRCSICGEFGHNKLSCPVAETMPRKNTVTCSQCGKPGHNSRSCPVRPRSTTVTCSLCGRDGHNCRTCPMRASTKKTSGPTDITPGSPAWVWHPLTSPAFPAAHTMRGGPQ